MPKFVTIGYGNRAGYDQTDPSVRDAAHEQDARLQAAGALVGTAGNPVQVRNHDDAGVQTTGFGRSSARKSGDNTLAHASALYDPPVNPAQGYSTRWAVAAAAVS